MNQNNKRRKKSYIHNKPIEKFWILFIYYHPSIKRKIIPFKQNDYSLSNSNKNTINNNNNEIKMQFYLKNENLKEDKKSLTD
jgi:hypothetical protein